jgi:hypothetical protein
MDLLRIQMIWWDAAKMMEHNWDWVWLYNYIGKN